MATREGFERDPALVWGWYESRRLNIARTMPNAGHIALRALEQKDGMQNLTILTQNVDDLHEHAGSSQVIHLHRSIFASRCLACGSAFTPKPSTLIDPCMLETDDGAVDPPRCKHCDAHIRPGVVWFGEELPKRKWALAVKQVQEADLMLVVGTSRRVYPAASLPEIALKNGVDVWVIDPDDGGAAGRWLLWRSTAATALPELVRACGARS